MYRQKYIYNFAALIFKFVNLADMCWVVCESVRVCLKEQGVHVFRWSCAHVPRSKFCYQCVQSRFRSNSPYPAHLCAALTKQKTNANVFISLFFRPTHMRRFVAPVHRNKCCQLSLVAI